MIEEEPSIPSNEKDTSESILDSIMSTDKELKRLLHEKQMLLARLLNIPQDKLSSSIKPNTTLEAITYATSYRKDFPKIPSFDYCPIIRFR